MIPSENLILDKPTESDFQRFYEINSDPETNLFNPKGAMNYENAKEVFRDMLDHWKDNNFGVWKISEKRARDFIIGFGGISYRGYGEKIRLNIGYRFDKNYWGKGYATELAKRAIKYAFEEMDFEEIYALVRPKHLASIRVLEKCHLKLVDELADVPNAENSLIYKIQK